MMSNQAMNGNSEATIKQLAMQLAQMQQAILSATGVLRESNDPKAREAANVLYKGVKGGKAG
jgi:hypothetical protein